MDITIKQKKLIFVILSSALLIFIFVFGINTYYKENKQISNISANSKIIEAARSESKSCMSGNEFKNGYRVCCTIQGGITEGSLYNCSSQEYFEPGEDIYIVFDSSRFDISYDPYFLRINSDLNYIEDRPIMEYIPSPLDRKEVFLMSIFGTVPQEVESFTLLKLRAYSDNTFNEKDGQVILYREAKVSKRVMNL